MNITLRTTTPDDLEWLEPFYESLMRPYVELTHEWDSTIFPASFVAKDTTIIQADGKDIGMLKWLEKEDHIYLGDIQIKPDYQGKGIGAQLVQQVIKKANALQLPVRLKVLKGNPAINLYQRLGFVKDEEVNKELSNCYQMMRPFTS